MNRRTLKQAATRRGSELTVPYRPLTLGKSKAYWASTSRLGVGGMSERIPDVAARLNAARAGSAQALGEALEACRGYLLQIARQELDADLQAKGGASDLVQETFLK